MSLAVKKYNLFFKSFILTFIFVPALAFAAPQNFKSLISIFLNVIDKIIPIVFGLAMLAFFWGLAKYIYSAGSDEQRKEAKNIMTWGLVGVFVMVSFYGIVKLFGASFLPNVDQFQGGDSQPTYREMDDGSYRNLLDPRTGQPYPGIEST